MAARELPRVGVVSAEQVRPLRWALGYARALGWPLVPCWSATPEGCGCPQGASCPSPGKHPITRTGRNGASAAEGELRRWWTRYPEANVGVATGWESGIAVLDIDSGEALAELVSAYGPMPETARARTGRDGTGMHFYFRHPSMPANPDVPRVVVPSAPLLDGADRKGIGGMVMLAPSRHASGRRYAWEVSPRGLELPLAPEWMTETREPPPPPADLGPVADGLSAYGSRALAGVLDELAEAKEGTRNDMLNRASYRLGRLRAHIPPEVAATALLGVATGIGLTRAEAEGTLRSGYLAGVRAEQVGPEVHAA